MKSNIWIKWYKVLVYISVVAILLVGLAIGVDEAYNFGELLIYVIPFVLLAGLDLVVGMLLASFFENVQVIREKLEGSDATTQYKEKNTNTIGASLSSTCPECGGTIFYTKGTVETSCPWCFKKVYIIPNEQNK